MVSDSLLMFYCLPVFLCVLSVFLIKSYTYFEFYVYHYGEYFPCP